MIAERILYRTRQFWNALSASPGAQELAQAENWLNDELMALFRRMSPGEQAHSLQVLNKLHSAEAASPNELHPDLAVAALLHDVGKSRFPLRLWERVLIVVAGALFHDTAKRWGNGQPRGWRQPFVVANQHAEWGAQMAARAGASPLAVALIRRHQNREAIQSISQEDQLLQKLQTADHLS